MKTDYYPEDFRLTKRMAFVFFMVVVSTIGITALPLYTIRYISIESSLALMVGLEFLISLIVYFSYLRHLQNFKNKPSIKTTTLALVTLSLMQILSFFVTAYGKGVQPTQPQLLEIFLLLLVVPFYEEVIYRGCLFGLVNCITKNILVSSLVTSLVFSLMHTQYNSIAVHVMLFFMSIILVNVRVKTNGLYSPMLVHSGMNALVIMINAQSILR
ncbi:TPA: CPBP family intramembrane metalloprotease [Klebsiella aerogenes]|nr:CPBP family intramembrane metalloprotease [Klebsiella aerogenes]